MLWRHLVTICIVTGGSRGYRPQEIETRRSRLTAESAQRLKEVNLLATAGRLPWDTMELNQRRAVGGARSLYRQADRQTETQTDTQTDTDKTKSELEVIQPNDL